MELRNRVRQRLLIEELIRRRRSDDAERFAEVFRRSTVDPNPHQIEAAMFALQRLSSGGAMLCDEVGLGKTIEAGLVITQLRAEGKSHILIIVPLALARQWQVELQDLFSLRSTIIGAEALNQTDRTHGIFIIGRESASTPRGQTWLQSKGIWDLVVIDEAHEMFATIHTRFSKSTGEYQKNLSKGSARRAAQVKSAIEGSPILLLTATPLQNNLYEIWGLLQFVDPEQRVLGKFNEFCSLFVTGEGGREVIPQMEETLRRRLSLVLKRTLRRQAQPFMKQPFRMRHVLTANFSSERLESELHREINKWLAKEKLAAYRKGHRTLMALQLRRRMASSIEALASTLSSMKQRMLTMRETGEYPHKDSLEIELENIQDEDSKASAESNKIDVQMLEEDLKEIERLESLALQVRAVGSDVKKKKLLELIQQVANYSMEGVASDKVVVFTESVRTLESLFTFLEANGFKDQVTTFSGTNEGAVAARALACWEEEVGRFQPIKPEPGAAIRGALIHEFKTKTKILLATEAGAKGLNLQFCNCLVNYDLPWNPQRIEQRIGRVHRYGQQHDVVIINFINLSNEAEQRVYDLLEKKLHVFTETLGASDSVINKPEIALNFESRVNEILDRCRNPEDIQREFDRLNLELDQVQKEMRDEKLMNARALMGDLDSTVQARLNKLEGDVQIALSRCDETLLQILDFADKGSVKMLGSKDGRTLLEWQDKRYHIGPPEPGEEFGEPLHSTHPEVLRVINDCIEATDGQSLDLDSNVATLIVSPDAESNSEGVNSADVNSGSLNSGSLNSRSMNSGLMDSGDLNSRFKRSGTEHSASVKVYRITLSGMESEDVVLVIGALSDDARLGDLFPGNCSFAIDLESGMQALKDEAERHQREYVDKLLVQLNSRRNDLKLVGDASIAELKRKLEQADRARRMANSPAASAKAQAQQTKLTNEIEKTRASTAAENEQRLRDMDEEDRRIRLLQFVEANPKLLFELKFSSKLNLTDPASTVSS